MKKFPILFLALFLAFQGFAQENDRMVRLKNYEDTLGLLGHVVLNDSLAEKRFASTQKMIKTLVQALKIENSYDYPFSRMRNVSILYPPDSTFRIFTWQLYVDVNDYRYYGAIQMNEKELKLFPLIDRSTEVYNLENATLKNREWYGSVYYNIQQFDTPEGRKYLLFGYDGYSLYERRKVVDVLHFKDNDAIFGAPVFTKKTFEKEQGEIEKTYHRLVMTYTAEATIKLNFDENLDLIVFSVLSPMNNPYSGAPTFIPIGSYDGYKLENGQWMYQKELFTTTMDEAPRPMPLFDGANERDGNKKSNTPAPQKNIFGKKGKY